MVALIQILASPPPVTYLSPLILFTPVVVVVVVTDPSRPCCFVVLSDTNTDGEVYLIPRFAMMQEI